MVGVATADATAPLESEGHAGSVSSEGHDGSVSTACIRRLAALRTRLCTHVEARCSPAARIGETWKAVPVEHADRSVSVYAVCKHKRMDIACPWIYLIYEKAGI